MHQHAFSLPDVTECRCSHVGLRTEFHGEDHVRAIDLAFWKEGPNDLLNLIDPRIRTAIYHNAAGDAGQVDMPAVLSILPNLRLETMAAKTRWRKGEHHKGYRFICDFGLGDARSNVDLTDCTVTGWWWEAKEGGTVKIGWTVQYAGEVLNDEAMRGRLTGLADQPAYIVLNPPPVLQIVKGKGKAPKAAGSADDGGDGGDGEDEGGDLLADGDDDDDQDTPEKALERAAAGA